jgi:hypothetical protein
VAHAPRAAILGHSRGKGELAGRFTRKPRAQREKQMDIELSSE